MDKLPNPFVAEPDRFALDEDRFLIDIADPLPLFLTSPTREFLIGCGMGDVLEILDAH